MARRTPAKLGRHPILHRVVVIEGCFTPVKFLPILPALTDEGDVDLATKLRAAIRRSVNRGSHDGASRFAILAAELVRKRAGREPA